MLESVRYALLALAIVNCAVAGELSVQGSAPLFINEVLAANSSTLKDPQGQYDDWIEIYNGAGQPVDIGGMYLTDDSSDPTKWRIPANDPGATTVAAGGFLIIWADDDTTDAGLHAGFKLSAEGEEVALFDKDGVTLIDDVAFEGLTANVSFGRLPDGGPWQLMASPTPGGSNRLALAGVVADVEFSHDRGFYDAPFDVALTCPTPGATIYYTVDGSEPYDRSHGLPTGHVYAGPIHIAKTICLRAVALKPEWLSNRSITHTYIFLSNVLAQSATPGGFPLSWGSRAADYAMDPDIVKDARYGPLMKEALLSIPSMSITASMTDLFDSQKGFYANPTRTGVAWERPCSVELIYPDGTPGFQVNCGIRVQGGAFRDWGYTPKKSLRLLFKSLYGPSELHYPLFGDEAVDHFNTITLRAGANDGYSWNAARYTEQYIRDEFGRSLQRATGNPGSHGTFVHLYVNGLYWGLYNPAERPDASFSASYCGANVDDWDALHDGAATNGNTVAWNQMLSLCRTAATSSDAYQRLQGRNPDGTPNPAYPILLNVTNYIDYMIVNFWGGNWDWPGKNWYAGRDRTADSTGFQFYCWDYENTMGNNRDRSPLDKNALNNSFTSAGEPHQYLRQNAEYRMLFADRVHRFMFNGSVLMPTPLMRRYESLAEIVEKPIIAESARWGDQSFAQPLTQQDWLNERNWILNTYLPQRTGIVLNQFRSANLYPNVEAPVFYINGIYQHGGHINAIDSFSMQKKGPLIYYTLDNRDPRFAGQGALYNGPTKLSRSTWVKARASSGGTWSALNEAIFAVGPVAQSLRISEIMYHPADTGKPTDPNTEFIELTNIGTSTINLNLAKFAEGVDFTFPSFDLAPGRYCLVVKDTTAFDAKYGSGLPVAGRYAGNLNNAGEQLELLDAAGTVIAGFHFKDGWFRTTDGMGFSLTVKDPRTTDPNALGDKSVWRPSVKAGGSPGADDSGGLPADSL